MDKRIRLVINKDGTISADTINVFGKECLKYMEMLEELLEAEIIDSDYKEEFYQKQSEINVSIEHLNYRRED
ncbi:DUF2997 domain-containing protein [Thalassobacillus pellis]|uniref:DUF2997 domain-containing protein n=1 Tax=Thalassobacillus pellis TaxID=748008 RepID=UPI00195F3E20|nr:DUF2997 domain-containing protein [Thalassobacillus pellis]MBM7553229.1 hypothetical protein [Thalassobacillus pellis]